MFYAAKSGMKALPKILLALTAVAALSVAYPASANLITNPGFETGDFTGWTVSGFAGVTGTINGVVPHSGSFQGNFVNATASQNLTTTPGASYTINFFLALANNLPVNSFSVSWGGVTLLSLTNQSSFGYTEYTFNVTASTASTALLFGFNQIAGHGGWLLDDVSVNPAGVGVPDGGSTVSLLGCALLGLAALRRKLGC
jgi:VPDSG-CTERM motif